MNNVKLKAGTNAHKGTDVGVTSSSQTIAKPNVSGALHSLLADLKGFQEMGFLTADVKSGLGIAIEQVERYIRGDLEARQQ